MNAPIFFVGAQRTSLLALDFDSTCIVVLIFALHHQSTCFWFQVATVETVYKHHPRWKANAMLIASYVYVQILFYYIIDKLFSKGVGGSSFGGFKKFL